MPEQRILFLSLSRQSTGEVRFFTSSLKAVPRAHGIHRLAIDGSLCGLFADFPGEIVPAPWSRKLTPHDVLMFLAQPRSACDRLVILDLNSAILEYSWTGTQAEEFLNDLARLGMPVAVYDVMGVMERKEDRLRLRRERTERAIDAFITENLAVPGKASVKKSFYFGKYLKPRTMSQLVRVPDSVELLRSVPYTWPEDGEGEITYFGCRFEEIPRTRPKRGKAVVGFSKMVENLLPADAVAEFFQVMVRNLSEGMGIHDLVVVDPCRFLSNVALEPKVRVEVHERIGREVFLAHLAECEFAGFFIPTATVGVTAIQNGIPFVSFVSSQESTTYVKHVREANAVPRFTSLGIWEDFAYISELLREGNPYFKNVRLLDVSRPDEFRSCRAALDDGSLQANVDRYRSMETQKSFPDFEKAVIG